MLKVEFHRVFTSWIRPQIIQNSLSGSARERKTNGLYDPGFEPRWRHKKLDLFYQDNYPRVGYEFTTPWGSTLFGIESPQRLASNTIPPGQIKNFLDKTQRFFPMSRLLVLQLRQKCGSVVEVAND